MKAYLNASEMAKLLHVDRTTVSRWLNKGLIARAVRVKGSKQWRIPISAYEELIAKKDHESN
jgi:excisionase family DNA binding protein